jgi:hypothetical protein
MGASDFSFGTIEVRRRCPSVHPKQFMNANSPEETSVRNLRLLSTTAAILLLGVGAVSAQGTKTDETPGAPAAQQKAPPDKMAPSLNSDQRKVPETTGQAAPKSDNKPLGSQTMDKGAPAGAAANDSSDSDRGGNGKAKSTNGTTAGGSGAASSSGKSGDENKSAAGQGAASGSAKLSTEQRTKISTIVRQHKVASTQLNVSVRVGTRVPDSVHFYPLPEEAYVIYPEWRGYDYILVGDEIVVLDPRTHEIVAILEA